MIARGKIHSSGSKLAAYLLTGKEGERTELLELRGGLPGETVQDLFTDLQATADSATKTEKPFFHAHIRLPNDERLSRQQWMIVADRMEAALGFQGQPRAVALHHGGPEGNHLHVAWSRINADTMTAIDPGLYALKMKAEARLLERDFGLRQLDGGPNPDRLTKTAKQAEFEQARRLDTELDAIRNGIRQAWDASDNGPSLQAAIAERGWILARGDRRDFLVIDERGGEHALGKRVCGVTAGEVKARLGGDEFKRSLPHVDEAKEIQRQRSDERDREQQRDGGRKSGDSSSPRAIVATSDGGLVAQEGEAMRQLKRQARDARVKAAQADINAHTRSDDGRDNNGGRRRSRDGSRLSRRAAWKPEEERPAAYRPALCGGIYLAGAVYPGGGDHLRPSPGNRKLAIGFDGGGAVVFLRRAFGRRAAADQTTVPQPAAAAAEAAPETPEAAEREPHGAAENPAPADRLSCAGAA